MTGYSQSRREAAVAYFRDKATRVAEQDTEAVRRALWAVLNDIYGPTPIYKKIDQ